MYMCMSGFLFTVDMVHVYRVIYTHVHRMLNACYSGISQSLTLGSSVSVTICRLVVVSQRMASSVQVLIYTPAHTHAHTHMYRVMSSTPTDSPENIPDQLVMTWL